MMVWKILTPKNAAMLLVVGCSLFLTSNAFSMFKVCLFSPVKGKVVLKGLPVVGAVIERTCEWNWKKYEPQTDQTVTDEKGEFSLPGIYSWLGVVQLVPHEPVIHQQILIKHGGVSYNAWAHDKHDYGEFAELEIANLRGTLPSLNGKPINLYCDLSVEPTNHGGVWGYGGLAEVRQIG